MRFVHGLNAMRNLNATAFFAASIISKSRKTRRVNLCASSAGQSDCAMKICKTICANKSLDTPMWQSDKCNNKKRREIKVSSNHPQIQKDLFEKPVYATLERVESIDLERFRSRIKRALSHSIRESGIGREQLCHEISQMPGIGTFSRAMLDNYTSESKQHDISLVRFKALSRQLQAPFLWDVVLNDEGVLVLQGD